MYLLVVCTSSLLVVCSSCMYQLCVQVVGSCTSYTRCWEGTSCMY